MHVTDSAQSFNDDKEKNPNKLKSLATDSRKGNADDRCAAAIYLRRTLVKLHQCMCQHLAVVSMTTCNLNKITNKRIERTKNDGIKSIT